MNGKIPLAMLITTAFLIVSALNIDLTDSADAGLTGSDEVRNETVDISFTIDFDPDDLKFSDFNDLKIISADGYDMTTIPGEPMIPMKEIRVVVPHDTISTSFIITGMEGSVYPYTGMICGNPHPSFDGTGTTDDLVEYESEIENSLEYVDTGFIRGNMFESFRFLPAIPADDTLTITTHIEITLKAIRPDVPLEGHGNTRSTSVFTDDLESSVVNPDDIDAFAPSVIYDTTAVLQTDDVQYVIITNTTMVGSHFNRISSWKNQKGVPTRIVEMTFISNQYTGVDKQEKVRNFIKDAVNTWNTEIVLLGGDISVIPYRGCYGTVYSSGGWITDNTIPADIYYSDLDGSFNSDSDSIWGEVSDTVDLHPDVIVGRAPVQTSSEANTFVTKTLKYETDPDSGYLSNATMAGEYLDSTTNASIGLDSLKNNLLTSNYVTTSLFDNGFQTVGSLSKSSFRQEINQGAGLIFHMGHCNYNVMSVGSPSGSTYYLYNGDISAYNGGSKIGVLSSTGCIANSFERNDCIAELHVKESDGGTVSFIGNSRYGWYWGGMPGSGPSDVYQYRIAYELFKNDEFGLGEQFAEGKDNYVTSSGSDGAYRWIQYCLNLLGDPEMMTWTDEPSILNVSYSEFIGTVNANYSITVTNSTGSPVAGALVCLQQSGYYHYNTTNPSGEVLFNFSTVNHDAVNLTVTAHNFLPFNTSLTVDSIPPEIGAAAFGNATTGDPFNVSVHVSDNVDVSYVSIDYYQGNSSDISTVFLSKGAGDWNGSIPIMVDSVENVTIRFNAVDQPGNTNSSDWMNVTVMDNDAPEIISDNSDTSGTTGDEISFEVEVDDNIGVSQVILIWGNSDGTGSNDVPMTSMDNLTWNADISARVDSTQDIWYVLTVLDINGNNNTMIGENISISDNDVPRFTNDISDESGTTGDEFKFAIGVLDNIGIGSVLVEWWLGDTKYHNNDTMTEVTDMVWALDIDLPHDRLESIGYRFHAVDSSDNWNESSPFGTGMTDDDLPYIISDYTSAEATTGDPIDIRVVVSDNLGIDDVTVSYGFGTDIDAVNTSLVSYPDGNWTTGIGVPSDSLDELTYSIIITDISGNINRTGDIIIPTHDNDPPIITGDTSLSVVDAGDLLNLNITATDNIGLSSIEIKWWLGGSDDITSLDLVQDGAGSWSGQILIPADSFGSLYYRVYANDTSGNIGEGDRREVSINIIYPDDPGEDDDPGGDDEPSGDDDPAGDDEPSGDDEPAGDDEPSGDDEPCDDDPGDDDTDGECDKDEDGMIDSWELDFGLDPTVNDAGLDLDGDGYTNIQEFDGSSDPSDVTSIPSEDTGDDIIGDYLPYIIGLFVGLILLIAVLTIVILSRRSQGTPAEHHSHVEIEGDTDDDEYEDWG